MFKETLYIYREKNTKNKFVHLKYEQAESGTLCDAIIHIQQNKKKFALGRSALLTLMFVHFIR